MTPTTSFQPIWAVPEARVAEGAVPGYAAAVRIGGRTEVRCGGRTAIEPDAPPVREDTLFRLASVTKPMGGALTLSLACDGVIGLDDPVDRWLPELAAPRVLTAPDAPLDDTAPATRPITVRHLLTMTCGWGVIFAATPLQAAMVQRGVFPSAVPPSMSGDSRGRGGSTPGEDGLDLLDPPDGAYADATRFAKLSGGLVSTVGDVLRFYTAMADGGAPALDKASVARMTADALSAEQRRQAEPIVGAGASWGLATGVDIEAAEPWMAPGRWGWTGGTGTTAYVDPVRDTVSVLLTQRGLAGPRDGFDDFWTAVAEAA